MTLRWYFVRCQSGREKRIRDNALHRLNLAGMTDVIPQVLVPYELVAEMRKGKKRTCLLYTSPSPRDKRQSRMPSSA